MSHFSTIKTALVDRDALVEGLKNLLAERKMNIPVEVYDTPQVLFNGYSQRDRAQAEIVLRREYLGTHTDIGFGLRDGAYAAEVDSFDYRRSGLCKHFKSVKEFLQAVQQAHNEAFVKAKYPSSEWECTTDKLPNGGVKLILTKKEEEKVWL